MTQDLFKLDIFDSFEELPRSSFELLTDEKSLFLDYDWFHAFSEHICHALGKPRWISLTKNGETQAVLPMVERKLKSSRVLHSMSNYYSPYFELLSSQASQKNNLETIAELGQNFFQQFDIVEFQPVCESLKNNLISVFGGKKWSPDAHTYTSNWRECGITDFASYWERRPSQLKATIIRKKKKLSLLNHEFKIFTSDLSDKALADYHYVYFKSWKKNEPFPAFIDALAKNASAKGALRLGILYIESQPVAAQIWLINKGTAFIVKLAYHPDYHELSVGSLLSARLFEHSICHDRVTTIDYLTGNDHYKSDWVGEHRELYGIQLSNRNSYRGQVSLLKNFAGKMLNRAGALPLLRANGASLLS